LFRIAAPLMIICWSVGSAGCAPTTPYNPDRLAPAQMSRIGEICHTVMGLPAGHYTDYQACEESLSHSLAARRERSATVAAPQTCDPRGLKPDALGQCEQHPRQKAPALGAPPSAPPVKSYFFASNDEIHRRAQSACADIGEDPATGTFAQCVADLESYLFAADHPINGR
jgi:hypothetical protein